MERWSAPQHERFLRELDAGEPVRVGAEPLAWLQHAVFAARRGDFVTARRSVRRARSLAPGRGVVELVAGIVLYVTRDYDASLACFRSAARSSPRTAERAYQLAFERASRLGWTSDRRELLEALAELRSRNLGVAVDTAHFYLEAREWRLALIALRRACELEPNAPALWMERASAASFDPTDEGEYRAEEVASCVAQALRRLEADAGFALPYLLEGAQCLTRVGRLDEAQGLLERAFALAPASAEVSGELGERALWRGDLRAVAEHAARLRRLGDERTARRLEAGGAMLRGRPDEALASLSTVRGDYLAEVWRAEALLALGRLDEAHDALTRASMAAPGFLPVAWVLRLRLALRAQAERARLKSVRFGEVRELLLALDFDGALDARAVLGRGDPDEVDALLVAALGRLGGNRSTTPTILDGGTLRRLPPLAGAREASRRTLELVRALPPEEILRRFDDVAERFAGDPLPDAHRGELLLWLGRYRESRQALERALETHPATRWPYIGLSAIDILGGEAARALETSARGIRAMNGTVGAAVHVHEGEALRRLGRYDEAIDALERAVALHPDRLSATIQLILARRARDPDDDVSELVGEVFARAPGLLSDAAASLSIVLWKRPTEPEMEHLDALLERALELMRGNRSSTLCTYVTDDGRLRTVPLRGRGRDPHAGDEDDLMRARGLLLRAAGVRRDSRRPSTARPVPAGLSSERIERFLSDGFLRLPRALDPAVARQWRQRALRHIRVAPHRCVKGWDGSVSLADLDPDDPSTWSLDRIDCALDAAWPFAELMPQAWELICALVGGEERLQTRTMGEYLILNLRERASLGVTPPHPQWGSWHMDAPSSRTTLDSFSNGLVLVVLFDDVEPDRGPTYIAPDSVREVARELKAGPVDFVDRRTAARIMQRCPRRLPLVGEVGDVFVLHPFMLHSSSPNPSGRIRWMSNPVLFLREPLRFVAPAPSPVEEAVVRALRD